MGMRYYSNYGLGLLLSDSDEIESFVEKIQREYNDDEINVYQLQEYLDYEAYYYGPDDYIGGVRYFEGNRWIDADELLVLYADEQPDAFKPAYKSIDEIVEEMKERYSPYFDEGFDYKAHIGWFDAVTWG